MGKRVDQSARTVIGPDPTLRMGQIGLPKEIADNLTVPVRVAHYNKSYIDDLVNSKNGARFVITNNGKTRINLESALFNKGTRLNHGDLIVRNGYLNDIIVNDGRDILHNGDRLLRDGKEVEKIIYPHKRRYDLKIGDIVERRLQDGDIVLVNRQPTLHVGSMQAMEIVIRPTKIISMNLSICKSFNADFDGDEIDVC
jgi:DNA-directed RNA polymerase beta' subunit